MVKKKYYLKEFFKTQGICQSDLLSLYVFIVCFNLQINLYPSNFHKFRHYMAYYNTRFPVYYEPNVSIKNILEEFVNYFLRLTNSNDRLVDWQKPCMELKNP